MEQLVARRAHNPKVVGSSPTPATKNKLKVKKMENCMNICNYCNININNINDDERMDYWIG